ncbi:MAG: sugar transferase [bacterium]|nr:sugar transferase [bacterium]
MNSRALRFSWILGDVFFVNLAYVTAFLIRFGGAIPARNFESFLLMAPLVTVVTLLALGLMDLYTPANGDRTEVLIGVLLALALSNILSAGLTYYVGAVAFPRGVLAIGFPLQVMLMGGMRAVTKSRLTGAPSAVWLSRSRVPGTGRSAETQAEAFGLQSRDDIAAALDQSADSDLYLYPTALDLMISSMQLSCIHDSPVLHLPASGLAAFDRSLKRCSDLVLAGLGLVLTAPLLPFIALGIKLSGPGPVVYSQVRLGRGMVRFRLYKFRTMVMDAEEETGPTLAEENDARVTPFGSVLRRLRIDEIPQLVNVLKGDMSVVGPRPERPYFVEQLQREIPGYGFRFLVKPGLTGLAQVMGNYDTAPEDKLLFDIYYILNHSHLQDLKIVLQTAKALLLLRKTRGVLRRREERASSSLGI